MKLIRVGRGPFFSKTTKSCPHQEVLHSIRQAWPCLPACLDNERYALPDISASRFAFGKVSMESAENNSPVSVQLCQHKLRMRRYRDYTVIKVNRSKRENVFLGVFILEYDNFVSLARRALLSQFENIKKFALLSNSIITN